MGTRARHLRPLGLALASACLAAPAARAAETVYVSPAGRDTWSGRLPEPSPDGRDGPFATLERARDAVRALPAEARVKDGVTVRLRGGRYRVASAFVLGPEDSGAVTYAAQPGEVPVIDGGTRVTGFRVERRNGRTLWVAGVGDLMREGRPFRQLFVGGQRRPRAHLPKQGFFRMQAVPGVKLGQAIWSSLGTGADSFVAGPGDFRAFSNLTDAEVVALHFWIESRLPVVAYDAESRLVRLARKSALVLADETGEGFPRYYVDNVIEGLTEAGEWYLDRPRGELLYLPMPGERPDSAEVRVSLAPQLLRIEGRPGESRLVEGLRFEGIAFEHADWAEPYVAPQAAVTAPGAVRVAGARRVAFENCRFEHLGAYAIEIGPGSTEIAVVGNTMADLGAGGIKVNGADASGPLAERTGRNRITDNLVHAFGRVFHSAVGILLQHSFGNVVAHNHIHDGFYTGISCGWVWGYGDNVSKENRIEKNYIHDLGQGLLSDMGGIYTLGVQPGTVVRGNLVHGIRKAVYGGWAIYPDEGTSHVVIENNVCFDTGSQPFHQHYGRENLVRNNVFAFGGEGTIALTRAATHAGGGGRYAFVFERNIVVTDAQPAFVGGAAAAALEERPFWSDLNLFWDVGGREIESGNKAGSRGGLLRSYPMKEWQAMGYDRHSLVADPGFRNARERDFTMRADSPAVALGFEAIDLTDVGPRPPGLRRE
jgi:hypothetical protein